MTSPYTGYKPSGLRYRKCKCPDYQRSESVIYRESGIVSGQLDMLTITLHFKGLTTR